MNHQLRTVTVRIAKTGDGSLRAWSDDLKELSLTCLNHQELFAELEPMVTNLFKQQGFDGKIVREIHQYIVELEASEERETGSVAAKQTRPFQNVL